MRVLEQTEAASKRMTQQMMQLVKVCRGGAGSVLFFGARPYAPVRLTLLVARDPHPPPERIAPSAPVWRLLALADGAVPAGPPI